MNTRLEQLQKFLQEEPEDPFLIYAIATEFQKTDVQKAKEYFEQLLAKHSDYLPTYYQLAQLYFDLQEDDSAKQTYLQGIELAEKQGNQFTLRELKNAYQNFLFEIEED
ncbi:MAG: Tfp pilus assembly protein PilF [Arenicella sp.]|jgi:Tfp pilus assembly protein PilF